MSTRPALSRTTTALSPALNQSDNAVLELGDGSAYRGVSFGAEGKSVAGECVFQTGWFVSKQFSFFPPNFVQEWSAIPSP